MNPKYIPTISNIMNLIMMQACSISETPFGENIQKIFILMCSDNIALSKCTVFDLNDYIVK